MHNREITHIVKTESLSRTQSSVKTKFERNLWIKQQQKQQRRQQQQ